MKKTIKKFSIIALTCLLSFPQLSVIAYTQEELNVLKSNTEKAQFNLEQTRIQKTVLESNKDELNKFIVDNQNQLKDIEAQLNSKKSEVGGLKSNLNVNLEQIQVLNKNLNEVNFQTAQTKNKIEQTKLKIEQLENDIQKHSSELKKTLQYFQKVKGMTSIIKYLYHSKSLNGVVEQYKALNQISTFHKNVIAKNVKQNKELNIEKAKLEMLTADLVQQSSQIMNSQSIINNKVNILNNSINISEKIQENLNNLQNEKISKQKQTEEKLLLVKDQYNKLVSYEAKQSEDVQAKQYEVDVYAKQLSAEEKARIEAQINAENEQKAKEQEQKEQQAKEQEQKAQQAKEQEQKVQQAKEQEQKTQQSKAQQPVNLDNSFKTENKVPNKIEEPKKVELPVISSAPKIQPKSNIITQPTSANWIFPKTCHNITETYGEYHPELYGSYDGGYHHAVDYACGFGTKIFAPTTGKIAQINYSAQAYGTSIVFVTNYNGHQYKLIIGHLSRVNVYQGQVVNPGNTIGFEGSTGNSTGPHTHFEMWQDGYHVNPQVLWGW